MVVVGDGVSDTVTACLPVSFYKNWQDTNIHWLTDWTEETETTNNLDLYLHIEDTLCEGQILALGHFIGL